MKNKIIYSCIGLLFALACLVSKDALFIDDKSSCPIQKQEKPLQTKETKVIQLPVIKQKPNSRTCGFHAASNTATLNLLLQENKKLTRQNFSLGHELNFNRFFERMRGKTQFPNELTNLEISGALKDEQVHNVCTLVAKKDVMVINQPGHPQKRVSYRTENNAFNELRLSIQAQPINHFICNTGDHWVLLTRDDRHQSPTYYFADSLQNKTTAYANFNQYLNFVSTLA